MEANWSSVAKINSEAAEACTREDWEHFKSLMVRREEIIKQIEAEGIYEVPHS